MAAMPFRTTLTGKHSKSTTHFDEAKENTTVCVMDDKYGSSAQYLLRNSQRPASQANTAGTASQGEAYERSSESSKVQA